MSQKSIELAGIVRNLPDNMVPDGNMQEIINLRPKDGAWRPVGKKVNTVSVPPNVLFIHEISDTEEVYIAEQPMVTGPPFIEPQIRAYHYINGVCDLGEGQSGLTQMLVIANGHDYEFASLGKVLIMLDKTDNVKHTFVWKYFPDNLIYRYEQIDSLPDVPYLTFSAVDDNSKDVAFPISINYENFIESITGESLSIINENGSRESDGNGTGKFLLRFGWELMDGTIVKQTVPVFIELSTLNIDTATTPNFGTTWETTVRLESKKLIVLNYTSPATLEALKIKYKGIIKGLNLYCSRNRTLINTSHFNSAHTLFTEQFYIENILVENVDEYYKIFEVPIDEIDTFTSFVTPKDIHSKFSDLTGFPTIPTDNFSHHDITGKNMFVYNDRVMIGDITTKLNSYANATFVIQNNFMGNIDENNPFDVGFEFDISTTDGVKTVFTGWFTSMALYEDNIRPIVWSNYSPIGYPDSRATTVRVFVREGTVIRLVLTSGLKRSELLNFSYYEGPLLILGPWTNFTVTSLSPVKNTYSDPNRIQASEFNNPFFFPAKNSYRVGTGKVLKMSSNAIALSQGQFGQFPVYCFTSDGIWTMNIGDGEVLISTITPVSREVCNNPRSITQIDGGTVFATDKGLYILSGPDPIEISMDAEGNHLSRLTGTLNYEAIANNPNLYQIKESLCNMSFVTYLASANIAWDHIHKEIIVSKPGSEYSWVYSTQYKRWYKIAESFDSFVTQFPKTWGYVTRESEYIQCDISEEDYSELIPVHMETRPLKLSPGSFKKISRAIIGGFINSNLEFPFSVNLFGTPDKRSWYLLNASNTFSSGSQFLIGRSTFSCRLYIVVIGGKVDEEAYFTHVDVDWEENFGNKLR